LTLSLALRSRRECRSMCWALSVGGDGVTTRRSALSKRPCSLARRSAGWHAGAEWLIACCSPGVDKRRLCLATPHSVAQALVTANPGQSLAPTLDRSGPKSGFFTDDQIKISDIELSLQSLDDNVYHLRASRPFSGSKFNPSNFPVGIIIAILTFRLQQNTNKPFATWV
jgi:hypothetical protein